ncbi:MAG: AmmeMemoRadiSam system radical SAM enzyme [Anaerolineae bacterium CG2_30_64_16]|nr:MAG: AmmeMemoRadiSam system radical SAM enzyme [Anaerolineae bacterium CG2_30_64_16]
MSHEAILWERLGADDPRVRCNLCAHRCVIPPGRQGACCVRENRDGVLYTLVYGRTIAQHVDPIEKKPLFHFQPGSRSYSIATAGCNFRCAFCQNWEISQMPREQDAILGSPATPAQIAHAAQQTGCASVAYTYTEPTIYAEYALDTAREAQALGLKNVFVSNGYMTPELLHLMAGLIDGINVDLKAGRGEFYHRISGASLKPVLANLKLIQQLGIWLEVTTLVIPGLNDSDEELRWVAEYLFDEVGPDVPWHISRFYPQYRMADTPPTPTATLERAWQIGREVGLRYVYVGNVPGHDTESTTCPGCGTLLIERFGYQTRVRALRDGRCARCGTAIAGFEMP